MCSYATIASFRASTGPCVWERVLYLYCTVQDSYLYACMWWCVCHSFALGFKGLHRRIDWFNSWVHKVILRSHLRPLKAPSPVWDRPPLLSALLLACNSLYLIFCTLNQQSSSSAPLINGFIFLYWSFHLVTYIFKFSNTNRYTVRYIISVQSYLYWHELPCPHQITKYLGSILIKYIVSNASCTCI